MSPGLKPQGLSPRRLPGQVLSIGETVEEVNDSGFDQKVPTIRCQLMADDSMLQARTPVVRAR